MGGVSLGGDADNVAYRAVPRAPGQSSGFALPIGVIPLLQDPPTIDPSDPKFNVFELANLLQNPPWHLELGEPPAPSSDVVVSLGRDHLAIDLGDVRNYLPGDGSRITALSSIPVLGLGVRRWFASASMILHYENELTMNDALRRALMDGEDFHPQTEYAVIDTGRGQAVAALQTGLAMPLWQAGRNPRAAGSFGLYGGARVALLRGIAYGDARNVATFATGDTLFANAPAEFVYSGGYRDAGPSGGNWGTGFDFGTVLLAGGFEVGVGVNHLGARLKWHGEEKQVLRDSLGEYHTVTVSDSADFESRLPVQITANIARSIGGVLVAADVTNEMGSTEAHLGMERWFHMLALRLGGRLDERGELQGSTGLGLRLGPVGLDAALATHGGNFGPGRGLALGAGLSFYHRGTEE
jgi:hypothetical protein